MPMSGRDVLVDLRDELDRLAMEQPHQHGHFVERARLERWARTLREYLLSETAAARPPTS